MSQQASQAANVLPPETLIEIFSLLGARETDYTENACFGVCHRKSALRTLSSVCRSWSCVATAMLYDYTRITNIRSLKLFRRTLVSSPNLAKLVRHFTYSTPHPYPYKPRWEPRKFAAELDVVLKVVRQLPPSASLDLELLEIDLNLIYAFEIANSHGSQLSKLHYVSPLHSGRLLPVWKSFSFPHLRSLTLEHTTIDFLTAWPEMPLLRELRLVESSLDGSASVKKPDFTRMHAMTSLELLHVECNSDILENLLSACAPTLENLVLINVNCASFGDVVEDMRRLTALRTFCMGPSAFPYSAAFPRFSHTLERLTIWECGDAVNTALSFDAFSNTEGLVRLLGRVEAYPKLRTIRVRGQDRFWETWECSLEMLCRSKGIDFQLHPFKG